MQADESKHETTNGHATETPAQEFLIQRIYTKDASLESPNSPQLFLENLQPTTDIELNVKTAKLADTIYEVELIITATMKSQEKTALLVEVHQAGIFGIKGFTDAQLHHMLGSYCPNILFPYSREAISDLISRAGFAPMYLAPINFEALYEQQMQQQQAQATQAQSSDSK